MDLYDKLMEMAGWIVTDEENKNDLTDEQYTAVKAQIDVQQKMIQDTLLEGKAEYLKAVNG